MNAFAKCLQGTDIWVISDEIYEKLVYDGAKHFSIAKVYEKTVLINGLSKSQAMTGWRVGYTACCSVLAKAMTDLQSQTTSNINTPTQYAALEALTNPKTVQFEHDMVESLDKRRKYMIERLSKMQNVTIIKPKGAFYVMVNIAHFGTAHSVATELLEKYNVAVIPCESFGAPDYIRLSYTLPMDEIKEGLDRMEKYLI